MTLFFMRSKPLRIFLADLTYTTLSLATEAYPLNIGLVASYANKRFGKNIEMKLFKYIEELEDAIRKNPPDILGMSNYPWNRNIGIEFFKLVSNISQRTLKIMGGPNISHEQKKRIQFMKENPEIDAHVILEGEESFSLILERVLSNGLERRQVFETSLPGTIFRNEENEIIEGSAILLRKNLNEIPSPYLTGLLDPFFDNRLSPMIETNRGCPFTCAYCHEGHPDISHVRFFELDRVLEELDYIAAHVGNRVSNLLIADPNFGMYDRDLDICRHIADIKKRSGYPKFIFASAGKNKKEQVAEAVKMLEGSMKLWLSVQSMDSKVLKAIKRDNIDFSIMMNIKDECEREGITTISELILGLPEEDFNSHIESISKIIDLGVDQVTTYTCMLLEGTELSTERMRNKYGIHSHFRILPRDFGKLSDGIISVEIEEVVTSTNSLSFEDYLKLRLFHLIVNAVNNGKPFGPLFKFLREQNLSTFPLFMALVEEIDSASDEIKKIVASFNQKTKEELWASKEELLDYIKKEENYNKLLSGELGANLIQTHVAMSNLIMTEWCNFVFATAKKILSIPHEVIDQLHRFCAAKVYNIWGEKRNLDNPEIELNYDIAAWYQRGNENKIKAFKFNFPQRFKFSFTEEQMRIADEYIERFGATPTGIGRILMKTDMTRIWREKVERV